MSPREAFRLGFLSRCLDDDLTPAEIAACVDRATKTAAVIETRAKQAGLLGDIVRPLGMAAVALPVAGGAVAGYLAGKSRNEAVDVDDVKREELVREYRRLSRDARDAVRRRMVAAS